MHGYMDTLYTPMDWFHLRISSSSFLFDCLKRHTIVFPIAGGCSMRVWYQCQLACANFHGRSLMAPEGAYSLYGLCVGSRLPSTRQSHAQACRHVH